MSDNKVKRKLGRPVKRKPPELIPDTAENVTKSLLRPRPKSERDILKRKAGSAP